MIAFIIAITSGLAVGYSSIEFGGLGMAWGLTWGILTFLAVQISIGLIIRKKIMNISNEIQTILTEGQKKINRKIQQFQRKPAGGVKNMQNILEKEQADFIREALKVTEKLIPYCKWNFLISRQMNSMRMQFHYQLKEFDNVDPLLGKVIYSDPLTVAMKMARMYKNDSPGLEKFYEKKIKKFKGSEGILLYALYSWILVKRKEIDKAMKLLADAAAETDNEALKQNWKHLANGKIKKFSNAGIGDQWYALYLEEPKIMKPKQQRRAYR
jgi:hypothetical protein